MDILELENSMFEIKSSTCGFNSRLDPVEDRTSALE